MQKTMDALVRVMDGAGNTSLASLGYTHAGLDDFWQACGTGVNGSFHDYEGNPLINLTRFPNMSAMTEHGHERGLQVGWCTLLGASLSLSRARALRCRRSTPDPTDPLPVRRAQT